MNVRHFIEQLLPRFLNWGVTFLLAILILVIGWIVAGWASKAVSRLLLRSDKVDPTVRTFTSSFVRYSILIITLMAVLARVGVQTASLVALLGAAGLAVGLALQGTLSDVAAGVILLVVRPFRVGDTVQLAGLEGTVRSVALFTTEIATHDNRKVVIPNSKVWGQPIINISGYGSRRVEITVRIDQPEDVSKAIALVEDIIRNIPAFHTTPEASVLVESLTDGTHITARAWTGAESYGVVKAELQAKINTALSVAEITRLPRSGPVRNAKL
jgi:small conductance mechanosensitive channel